MSARDQSVLETRPVARTAPDTQPRWVLPPGPGRAITVHISGAKHPRGERGLSPDVLFPGHRLLSTDSPTGKSPQVRPTSAPPYGGGRSSGPETQKRDRGPGGSASGFHIPPYAPSVHPKEGNTDAQIGCSMFPSAKHGKLWSQGLRAFPKVTTGDRGADRHAC